MKRYFAVTLLALALARGEPATAAPLWTFDTIPADGALSGSVGDTVGWGYVVTNDDSRFLQFDGLSSPTSSLASLTDLFDFPTLAPFSSLTVPYSAGTAGLAEALLLSAGTEDDPLFKFTVTASFYEDSPLADPSQSPLETASLDAGASLTVRDAVQVPEPPAVILLALGIGLLAVTRRLIPHTDRGGRQ